MNSGFENRENHHITCVFSTFSCSRQHVTNSQKNASRLLAFGILNISWVLPLPFETHLCMSTSDSVAEAYFALKTNGIDHAEIKVFYIFFAFLFYMTKKHKSQGIISIPEGSLWAREAQFMICLDQLFARSSCMFRYHCFYNAFGLCGFFAISMIS
jgi:hypothetical protein